MRNLSFYNQHTIPRCTLEELKSVEKRTSDKKLKKLINAELSSRASAGVNRPLTIEDWI